MEVLGVVTRLTPYKEKDAIITVIHKGGSVSFLARGVFSLTSKYANAIEPLSFSRFELEESKKTHKLALKEAILIKGFSKVMESFEALFAISLINELTCRVLDDEESIAIYPYLKKSIDLLSDKFDPYTVCLFYFAKVLKVSGFGLEVNRCVISGAKTDICAISYEDGGFISKNAFSPMIHKKASENKLKIIRYIFLVEINEFGKVVFLKNDTQELLNEFALYLFNQTSIKLKSLALIN